jgi:hypothetical protein
MSSFLEDPESDHETSYDRPQARASSSRAPSTGYGYAQEPSIAPTSPSTRAFSLVPGTEDDVSLRGDDTMGMEDVEDDEDEGNDVKRLGKVWVKERGMGDILPWEGDLMDQLFDKLEQQVS